MSIVLDPEILAERWKDEVGCFRVVEVNAEVGNNHLLPNAWLAHVQTRDASLVQLLNSV
jgi:hypothetical protein